MVVSLTELKEHLGLDLDSTVDDAMLSDKIAAAQAHVESFVGGKLDDIAVFPDGTPAPLKEAVKQLAGHWFDQRGPVQSGDRLFPVPMSIWDMVGPYRTWSF